MNFPADLKYTDNDEWLRIEGSQATAGITDYAQEHLSDIVYVEILVAEGDALSKGDAIASVESVKAAAEVYAPAGGTVTAINEGLADTPETVNSDPYGVAWMIKFDLADAAEAEALMDAAAYQKNTEERDH